MRPTRSLLLALAVALPAAPLAADESAALPESPDAMRPADIIAAREELMVAAESLMVPIDTYTVDDTVDTALMRVNANAIAAMVAALPNLFPESTNLYKADDATPATLALPAIWKNFASFYSFAQTASEAATHLTQTGDGEALRQASLALRASCDACHAVNLLPYEEPEVTQEERDYIDSLFKRK
jgi:cytochrome c556